MFKVVSDVAKMIARHYLAVMEKLFLVKRSDHQIRVTTKGKVSIIWEIELINFSV